MKILTRIVFFVAAVSLFACGGGGGRGGEISVQLTYPGADASIASASGLSDGPAFQTLAASSYPLDPSNRILIRVLGPHFAPMEAWFNRSDGRGVIHNVPPGSKIVVEVDEYDSSAATLGKDAELLGRGWTQGITLAAGEAKMLEVAMHARGTILTICGAQAIGIPSPPGYVGTPGDSGDGGLATDARISSPLAVKVGPDDSIYISSSGKLKRIDRYGYISHFAGNGSEGPVTTTGIAASFAPVGYVNDIDIDPSGNVYLFNNQSQILKITDGIISKIMYDNVHYQGLGAYGSLAVLGNDFVYFANYFDNRIYEIRGSSIDEFIRDDQPHVGPPFNRMNYPINQYLQGITYASKSNSLIFADSMNNRIMELSLVDYYIRYLVVDDTSSRFFQEGVAPLSMFPQHPIVVKYNPVTGKIFFVEKGMIPFYRPNRVLYITPDDVVRTFAGTGILGFRGDGSRSDRAQLSNPLSISVDSRGNAYIADHGNHAIRMVVGGALGELPP